MGSPSIFDADWLQVRAKLRPDEWDAAAVVFGLSAGAAPLVQGDPPKPESNTETRPLPPAPPPEPAAAATTPLLWRVTELRDDTATATQPPWWSSTPGASAGDYLAPADWVRPRVRPLIPLARWHSFLKQALARPVAGREPDAAALVDRLARRQALRRVPMRAAMRWPRQLHLVCAMPDRLGPLAHDLARLDRATCQLLGTRVQRWPVDDAVNAGAVLAALRGQACLVLADAGLAGGTPGEQARWAQAMPQPVGAAQRPVLVLPAALRLGDRQAASAWIDRCQAVVLGDQQALRRLDRRRLQAAAGLAAQPAAQPHQAAPHMAASRALRASLLGNSWVDVDLLRALRRCLAGAGLAADPATEVEVWNDAAVGSDDLACTLLPEAQVDAEADFRALPAALREAVAGLHWRHLASPLTSAVYARRIAPLLAPQGPMAQTLRRAEQQGEQLMRGLSRAMAEAPHGGAWQQVGACLGRLADRSPELFQVADDGWITAWAQAHADDLRAGLMPVPGGLAIDGLAWLLADSAGARCVLQASVSRHAGAVSTRLRLVKADAGPYARPGKGQASAAPAGLAQLPAAAYWTLQTLPDEDEAERRAAHVLLARVAGRPVAGLALLQALPSGLGDAPDAPDAPASSDSQADRDAAQHAMAEWMASAPAGEVSEQRLVREWRALLARWGLPAATLMETPQGRLPADLRDHPAFQPPPGLATRRHLAQDDAATVRAAVPVRVRSGARQVLLAPFARPPWADWMSHDRLPGAEAGQWTAGTPQGEVMVWRPAGLRFALARGEGLSHYRLPHAAWSSQAGEGGAWREDQALACPPWAARHGVDEHGYWAEFSIQKLVQRMRFIPPGRFWMGSALAEVGRHDDETLHPVTLTRGYWLADSACTWKLWQAVTGQVPEGQDRAHLTLPVVNISHDDITRQFLPQLNRQLPGFEGRLPGEAEWEHAARAGTATAYPWGDQPDAERMNYGGIEKKGAGRSLPVRDLAPNAWGLHQMHGNVWEWCADGYRPYPPGEALDPLAEQAAWRVLRGGSWLNQARACRSAVRSAGDPGRRDLGIGFRLARELPQASRAEPAGSPHADDESPGSVGNP